MRKKILYLFILSVLSIAVQADVYCTHCKIKIQGNYLLSSQNQPFCSKACYSTILPKCTVCNKAIEGPFRNVNGKSYCSDKCYSTILPKCSLCKNAGKEFAKIDLEIFCPACMKLSKCSNCKKPRNKLTDYRDGRKFCQDCTASGLVFDDSKAMTIYLNAVPIHAKILGKAGKKIPPVKLVDMQLLLKSSSQNEAHNGELRGFYQETKKEKIVSDQNNKVVERSEEKVSEVIFLLNGISENDMLVTSLHELTHDWLADYYPGLRVAPLWLEEGFCQFVAYRYCVQNKLTKQAEQIKNSPDEVYGKGIKFYMEKFSDKEIKEVLTWFATQKYDIPPPIGTERKE